MKRCVRTTSARHRGSIYLTVLSASMVVTVLGLSALMVVRSRHAAVTIMSDAARARNAAQAAVEMGLQTIDSTATWRTTKPNGVWLVNQKVDTATFMLMVIDPKDGSLANNAADPVLMSTLATCGGARQRLAVRVGPQDQAMDALSTAAHSGAIVITSTGRVTASGAALSTNGSFTNDGTVVGNVLAGSLVRLGTVTGTKTIPSPAKALPSVATASAWSLKGTAIAPGPTLANCALGPGHNPFGTADANGVYVIDTAGGDLLIRNVRVLGTLVVLAPGKKVTITDAASIQNYRAGYPALVVVGDVEVSLDPIQPTLAEEIVGVSLNPSGVPYRAVEDDDALDHFPNELRGMVHVTGNLTLKRDARFRATAICNGTLRVEGLAAFNYDATITTQFPSGYIKPGPMRVIGGSWTQQVD